MSKELVASYEGELPIGWELATIGELITPEGVFIDGDWIESKDQDPNGDVRLLQLADIGDGFYKNKSSRFLTKDKAEELNCTFLKKGDVLLARMPDPLGRACIFPGDEKDCVTVVDVCVIRSGTDEVGHKWLMYWVNSPKFRNTIASLQSGTTRRRISRGNLATITFPVPPPEQQKRIVAKIEELFSHIGAGIAALNKSKQLLKQYRQSVLKAAVTGELTKQWRLENKDKLEPASELLERILKERREKWEAQQLAQFAAKGKMPKNDKWKEKYNEPEKSAFETVLPDTWLVCSFEELILELKNGISKKPSEESGLAILRISAVRPMAVYKDDVRYLPLDFKSAGFELENGDLLFTRYNGNPELVGVCGKVKGLKDKTVYPDKLMRARPVTTDLISTDYLELSLNCGISKDFIRSVTKTTAGQSGVAGGDVKKCPTVLAPYEEQVEISKIVSEKIEAMQRLETELDNQITKAEKNKQSILASAFTGRLLNV